MDNCEVKRVGEYAPNRTLGLLWAAGTRHRIGGAISQREDSHGPRLYHQFDRQDLKREALRAEMQYVAGEDGEKTPGCEQSNV